MIKRENVRAKNFKKVRYIQVGLKNEVLRAYSAISTMISFLIRNGMVPGPLYPAKMGSHTVDIVSFLSISRIRAFFVRIRFSE